jgi:glycine/D-amino acid oxidase-like deaminating enzyme
MTRDQIIQLAREAGIAAPEYGVFVMHRDGLYQLANAIEAAATTREREARQVAQIENEELKARLARAGLEQQRAVLAEREACARVCDASDKSTHPADLADAIRARSQS